jgi:uncharacterized repeat protein (TIGR01451 family)
MNRVHALLVVVGLATTGAMAQPAAYTGTAYTQNFDSLANTGTTNAWANGVTLAGWYAFRLTDASNIIRAGAASVVTAMPNYRADNGTSNSGAVYSFGATGSTNRTLGTIGSGTPQDQSFALVLRNDTATTYNAIDLSFVAQQWRNGGNTTVQTVEFDYGIFDGASDLTTLTPGNNITGYTVVPDYSLVSIVNTATAGALDGTLAANSANKSGTLTGVNWAPGQVLVLRWYDNNDPGNDHGMGIDNLRVEARVANTPNVTTVITDSPDPVQIVGGQLTYTITPNNGATNVATNATVTFTLPSSVQFISSSLPVTNVGQTYTIQLGDLASGPASPFQVVVQPNVEFPAAAPLNVAFTSAPGNNVTNVSTTVINSADLSVGVTSDAACNTTLGQTINYSVSLGNNGPAAAAGTVVTATLSPNVTYVSNTPSVGTVTIAGSTLTWNLGDVASFGNATLGIATTVASEGGQLLRATATSLTSDAVTSNNTATVQTVTLSTAAPLSADISSVFGAATNNLPVVDSPFPATLGTAGGASTLNQFAISRPHASSDSSKFVFVADTTNAGSSNTYLVVHDSTGYRAIAQEGVTVLDSTSGETLGILDPIFDRIQAINNAGEIAFTARTNAPGTPRVLVKATPAGAGYSFAIVARQGTPATVLGLTGTGAAINYGATMSVARGGMLADGTVAFSYVSDTGIRAAVTNNGATLLSRTGQAAYSPAGQANGTTANISTFRDNTDQDGNTRGFSITADGQSWMLESTLTNGTGITGTQDEVLVLKSGSSAPTVVLQEGYPAAGTGLTQTVGSYTHSEIDNDGQWISLGSFNLAPPAIRAEDFVLRNGNVVALTGQPIITGSTETWSDAVFASTFFMATARGNDYVVGGLTSNADSTSDSVLVHNGTTVLLREGQPINVGTTELPQIAYAGPILRNHRSFIDADRVLWTVLDVHTDQWACNPVGAVTGLALIKIALPGPTTPACLADINGDGTPDGSDFIAFINSFGIGDAQIDPAADVAGGGNPNLPEGGPDGTIDGTDFIAFINAFGAGC